MPRPSSCFDHDAVPQLRGADLLANLVAGVDIQRCRLTGVVGPWDDRMPCPAELTIGPEGFDVEPMLVWRLLIQSNDPALGVVVIIRVQVGH